MGHLRDDERDTKYPASAIRYIGALTDRLGITWVRGYVPPSQIAVREELRVLKASNAQVGTSIYGRARKKKDPAGKGWYAESFDLEQIDLSPFKRAALPLPGFEITAEMYQSEEPTTEDDPMSLSTTQIQEIVNGLTVRDLPDALVTELIAHHPEVTALREQVAELTTAKTTAEEQVAELTTRLEKAEAETFNAYLDGLVSELFDGWTVADDEAKKKVASTAALIRKALVAEIGADRDREKAKAARDTVAETYQPVLETLRDSLAGGAALVGNRRQDGHADPTPEQIERAIRETGIGA